MRVDERFQAIEIGEGQQERYRHDSFAAATTECPSQSYSAHVEVRAACVDRRNWPAGVCYGLPFLDGMVWLDLVSLDIVRTWSGTKWLLVVYRRHSCRHVERLFARRFVRRQSRR